MNYALVIFTIGIIMVVAGYTNHNLQNVIVKYQLKLL